MAHGDCLSAPREEDQTVPRFEVSRAVPSPQEEVATGEVPPLFLVRGSGPPPIRTVQALLREAEDEVIATRHGRELSGAIGGSPPRGAINPPGALRPGCPTAAIG
jgi:hypothetical protein